MHPRLKLGSSSSSAAIKTWVPFCRRPNHLSLTSFRSFKNTRTLGSFTRASLATTSGFSRLRAFNAGQPHTRIRFYSVEKEKERRQGGEEDGEPGSQPKKEGEESEEQEFNKTPWIVGISVLCGVYYVAHLERAPETGRLRFMDISPRAERRLADEAYAEVMKLFKDKMLPAGHPTTEAVSEIVNRLLEGSNLGTVKGYNKNIGYIPPHARESASVDGESIEAAWDPDSRPGVTPGERDASVLPKEWNLIVVHDPKVMNAFASYGTLVIFTGMFRLLDNRKDEIAATMAHVARHSVYTLGLDFGWSDLLSQFVISLPNSRTQEFEADRIGMKILASACFDPLACPRVMAKLAQMEGKAAGRISFLNTHPASARRSKVLLEMVPEALELQAANPLCTSTAEYLAGFENAVKRAEEQVGVEQG